MKSRTIFRPLYLAGPIGLAVAAPSQAASASDVSNCTLRSAGIHNLTVYGTEILYTVVPFSNSSGSTNGSASAGVANTDTSTSFEFQMFNDVLDVDAQCSTHVNMTADAAAAASAAATWHTCFVESRDTRITAAFSFDLRRRQLTVNETWVCDDGGVNGTAVTFQAFGTNNISTLCRETVNSEIGQHYCANVPDVPLPVNVTTT